MSTLSNQIEAAVAAWSKLKRAAHEERNQHSAVLVHAVNLLGSRKAVVGTPLPSSAIEPCAIRITAALERLERMSSDPATKPSAIQAVVDEMRIDLADWLQSSKETDPCT